MGSEIICSQEDLWCSANQQSIPEKGYMYRCATFPFVFVLLETSDSAVRICKSSAKKGKQYSVPSNSAVSICKLCLVSTCLI